jgi:eukaryotic-like serine/threonine-protein kinase
MQEGDPRSTEALASLPAAPRAKAAARGQLELHPGVADVDFAERESRDRDVKSEHHHQPPPKPSRKSHTSDVSLGQVVADRYKVISVLGEGGMGVVYRCRDLASGNHVALKRVITPEGRLAGDYINWFYKEARALASLSHPNIVDARDFGQLEDGSPFLVMELVNGLSLHDYSNARLSFPIIWSVVDQILSALAHAHSRRVIHGDLKPSNIIIETVENEPPKVHILDFGLAWLKEDPHDERLDGEKAMEFEPHAGAGTPGYMAPEQIMHEMHHVCGATDLYSLACVTYKLLAGCAPFSGDPKELLKLHAYEEPPQLKPAVVVPDGVVRFIMRCLNKRPWDRFEFAAEARRVWEKFAPARPVELRLWRFPRVTRRGEEEKGTTTEVTTPKLNSQSELPRIESVPPQKARGLLSIRPTPMVGRDEIRTKLLAVCDEVIHSPDISHRLVMLVGPAGVGKSRIAEWLAATVHEQGTMVPLTVRYRRIRGSSDGMLGAVTRHLNFERSDRTAIERSLMQRWQISSADPRALRLTAGTAEWLRPSPPGSDYVGPTGVRFAVDTLETRRQVVRFALRRIAAGRPLLFFLDDLHNAAQTTLDGLLRIHNTEPDQRILMVATVRSEDVQVGTATCDRLRRWREQMDGQPVDVEPMDPKWTAELLRASLPLDDEAIQEAVRRSRGVPLYALQQLHAWAHTGQFVLQDGQYRLPTEALSLRSKITIDLWESRLATLTPDRQQAAYAAATLGLDLRGSVLKAVFQELGLAADETIISLQHAEIILPRGPGRYNFAHALLQEHLFRQLSERPDSKRLFLAAATALTAHPLANTRRVVRQRCINLLYAGEPQAAATIFFNFLRQSWNGARQPLVTVADLDLIRGQLTGLSAATALRWRAEALTHLGRNDEALQQVNQALQLLSLTQQGEGGEEVAHCQRLQGWLQSEQGNAEGGIRIVQEALSRFQFLGDLSGMAQCELVLGRIELQLAHYQAALAVAQRGAQHFADVRDPLGRGHCLLVIAGVESADGAIERALQLTHEARAEFERSGYQTGQAETTAKLASLEHRLGNYHSALRGARDSLGLFESVQATRGQAQSERLLAMIAIDTDHPQTGAKHAQRAEHLCSEMRDPVGLVEARLLRAQAALAVRDFEAAREALVNARELSVRAPEPQQHYLLTRAWFQLGVGDVDGAQEALRVAPSVFEKPWQVGEHTPHLLARLARLEWPLIETLADIEDWRRIIDAHARSEAQPVENSRLEHKGPDA